MDLEQVQRALRNENLDGWLFYDFRKSNPIAYQVLSLPIDSFFSRRWFYFVPVHGAPVALVSAVEAHVLHALPGERLVFRTWQEIQSHLRTILRPGTPIATYYSPLKPLPSMPPAASHPLDLPLSFHFQIL